MRGDKETRSFRPAAPEEVEQVFALYQEAKGQPFCVWNDEYPTRELAEEDQGQGNLYVLICNGELAGALSVAEPREMDDLDCWQASGEQTRELGRIVVAKAHQGHGYAGFMVGQMLGLLQDEGCCAVHISAAVGNLPARHTYAKLGFCERAEKKLYGGDYVLLERLLP